MGMQMSEYPTNPLDSITLDGIDQMTTRINNDMACKEAEQIMLYIENGIKEDFRCGRETRKYRRVESVCKINLKKLLAKGFRVWEFWFIKKDDARNLRWQKEIYISWGDKDMTKTLTDHESVKSGWIVKWDVREVVS